jgi:hypothetical protein
MTTLISKDSGTPLVVQWMLFLLSVIIAVALTLPPSALSLMMKRSARKLVRLIWMLKQVVEVKEVVVVVVVVEVVVVVIKANEVNGRRKIQNQKKTPWLPIKESSASTVFGWWSETRVADGILPTPPSIAMNSSTMGLLSQFLLFTHTGLSRRRHTQVLLFLDLLSLVLGWVLDLSLLWVTVWSPWLIGKWLRPRIRIWHLFLLSWRTAFRETRGA